jgi:hypothetical protein
MIIEEVKKERYSLTPSKLRTVNFEAKRPSTKKLRRQKLNDAYAEAVASSRLRTSRTGKRIQTTPTVIRVDNKHAKKLEHQKKQDKQSKDNFSRALKGYNKSLSEFCLILNDK